MTASSATGMIELPPHSLIGKGLHRECYAHPDDPSRCVKVVVAGNCNENRREAAYYARLNSRGIAWDCLPMFYGLIPTNLGEGAVFDLVRDHDNRISLTLAHYLESQKLTARHGPALRRALDELRTYLLEQRVITMTLKAKNILFQQGPEQTAKLVVVDNIGNSDFIPLANYSARLAQWKIQRKWARFERSLAEDYADNPAARELWRVEKR